MKTPLRVGISAAIAMGVAAAIFLLLFASQIRGAKNTPEFDAASIKPNAEHHIDLGGGVWVLSGRTHCHGIDTRPIPGDAIALPGLGRCSVRNSTLKEMINIAYGLRLGFARSKINQMVIDGPSWASTAPFDIDAEADDPSNKTGQELLLMLQELLVDRFKLRFHHETRDMVGLVLLPAKTGLKLKPASSDETPNFDMSASAGAANMAPQITAHNYPVGSLADFLSLRLGRSITDKTGATGRYDFTLSWTPDETELAPNGMQVNAPTSSDSGGPSLRSALQEQLGLRLDTQKASVDVFVIDSAEMPTPN